jgi:small subunit ribosomal protein S6
MEKKHYECMFIISADTPETKREELIKQFAKMAGTDTVAEKWGMRKFATPINYKAQGFYVLLNFKSEPAVPNKMRDLMNITDGIVRHLFVAKNEEMLAQDIIRKQNRLRAIANRADERGEKPAESANAKPQQEPEQESKKAPAAKTETGIKESAGSKKEGEKNNE